MRKSSRIFLFMFSVSLIIAYFVPIWEITLDAPQYPEGLGFEIWINKMTGDLKTVNGLNHYIGMKTIEPDSIKELKIMPFLLGFLILFGVFTALKGKRNFLVFFVILFIIFGIAGAVDFYKWEYDYGHNLNPEAAIKVPGMTYQPPLLGSKELLNFTAYSYPSLGGYIMILSGLFSTLLLFYEIKFNKRI